MARARSAPRLSLRLLRVAGIDVRLHLTTLLLFGWILFEHARTGDWASVAEGSALVACVFISIVLHELGHALMARRYGIRTRDITLWPIGGVATLERMPERPREELAVAFAGPAVNVAIAAVLFGVLMLAQIAFDPRVVSLVGGSFLVKVLVLNLTMAAFNLLPAFPMDGGRVLRAVIAERRGRVAATLIAVRIGAVLAIIMGLVGLFFAPSLTVVALFVWLAGQQEAAMVQLTAQLESLKVADAMISDVKTLDAQTPVGHALQLSVGGFQHDFPVRSEGRLVGMLSRDALLDTLQTNGADAPITLALRGPATTVSPGATLADAVQRMQTDGARAALVLEDGALAGMLTTENVAERLAMLDPPPRAA